MGLIAYDVVRTAGYGKIIYEALVDSVEISLYADIYADIEPVLADIGFSNIIVCMQIFPTVLITGGILDVQSLATPEIRYKFGSYSGIKGYIVVVDNEGNLTSTPVPTEPSYLIYPLQALNTYRLILPYPDPTVLNYEISFDPTGATDNDIFIGDVRLFQPGYNENEGVSGLFLNLNPPVTATMVVYYTFKTINIEPEPGIQVLAPTF